MKLEEKRAPAEFTNDVGETEDGEKNGKEWREIIKKD